MQLIQSFQPIVINFVIMNHATMLLTRKQQHTFSKGPWCIKAKGGRYREARLSREFSAVDVAPLSDSQIPGRFISSSKLRNATKELA